MSLSRNQIEILIVGALILVFLVYNFGGLNIASPDNNESVISATNAALNASNESDNVSAANMSTNTYSAYGVSFKYPDTWSVSEDSAGDGLIFVSKDSGTQFQVQIMPNNGMSEQESIDSMKNSITFGWDKISSSTLTVDNKNAYKDTFIVNNWIFLTVGKRFEQIYFVKNNNTYLLLFQAQDDDFDKEKPNFDVILNSFKVQ